MLNENEIREIGLEKELFLLKNNEIMEPSLFGFPFDCMGFLVEIRSLPSDRMYPVITTLFEQELQYKLRANKFGFELKDLPFMLYNNKWVNMIEEKYKIYSFVDYTRNIYKTTKSHHTGVFKTENGKYKLTSGIHVHFSNRNIKTGEVLELPIVDIVKKMDEIFAKEIKDTGRIAGEWEPKAHGFEYRSLPCNTDIYKILKESFKILRDV